MWKGGAPESVTLRFRTPEADNEQYAYIRWHLSRVTGRNVLFESAKKGRKYSNPRALLRSMLTETNRICDFQVDAGQNTISATVAGLTAQEVQEISKDFQDEFGMDLNLRGQMSLF